MFETMRYMDSAGLFGGLIGGPIASLVYYDSAPEERFYVGIQPVDHIRQEVGRSLDQLAL